MGTLAERFEAKVDRLPGYGPHGACHPWSATRNSNGYGHIRVDGKSLGAHRVAWELANGPIPDGLCVLHHCDNRRCVNVECLFLGTYADNNADKESKGRGDHPKGSDIDKSKLNESDIPEIRQLLAEGVYQTEIGRRYGVTRENISQIKLGKTWRHA